MKPRPTSQRGVALIVVLATLLLTVSTCLTLARFTATAYVQQQTQEHSLSIDALLIQAEKPLLAWLETESRKIVLSPERETPEWPVLDDVIKLDSRIARLTVTAWDQHGMIPLSLAWRMAILSSSMPASLREAVTKVPAEQVSGLDSFLRVLPPEDVFPLPRMTTPVLFGFDTQPSLPSSQRGPANALGAYLATDTSNAINVNTAPIELVEAALSALGRGGIEPIRQSRARGELAITSNVSTTGNEDGLPRLTSVSSCWSFRIDIRVGSLRKSWWAIYRSDPTWRCVQRIEIPN